MAGTIWMALGLGVPFIAMVQSNDDDSQLVQSILQGNPNAFKGLVEQYQTRVYNVIYGMVHNREDAKELTQDTFIKAYKKLDSFQIGTKFYTWLCRIAVNTTIDHIRRMKLRQTTEFDENIAVSQDGSIDDSHYSDNPEKNALNDELKKAILEAIDQLPEDQKQVLILKEIDGLSYKEIAEIVGVPHGTVMSRLFYARKKMQEILEQYK